MSNALHFIMQAFSQDGTCPQAMRGVHDTYVVGIDDIHRIHVAASQSGYIELFAVIHPGLSSDAINASAVLEWCSSELCDPPFDWRLGIQPGTGMAVLCASADAATLDKVTFAAGMETLVGHLRQYASLPDALDKQFCQTVSGQSHSVLTSPPTPTEGQA